ncbi:MAG: 3-deoxy-manno-octulosonate cytidylyltransferase [Chloroflexi bacterium]|nr:3-deoxy-manno-octulosonate cytidylyltransferase [Chloroflexota bacterium]
MASTRFPGKPLAPILGLPMVEHVRRRAALVDVIDRVVVATCDEEVMAAVARAGGEAVMTADSHERCTERVEEAMRAIPGDIVVIVQGDEPLLSPASIRAAIEPVLSGTTACTNVLNPIRDGEMSDRNVVKAVCDQRGDLMYLTRAAVPHRLHPVECPVYRQTGLMAMTIDVLRTFVALPPTPFERAESIDILRLLEHGHRVRGVPREDRSVGVDVPSDVDTAEGILRSDPQQSELYERTTVLAPAR